METIKTLQEQIKILENRIESLFIMYNDQSRFIGTAINDLKKRIKELEKVKP